VKQLVCDVKQRIEYDMKVFEGGGVVWCLDKEQLVCVGSDV